MGFDASTFPVSARAAVRQKTFFSSLTEDKDICSGRNVLYPHYSECTVTRVTISQFEDSFLDEAGYVIKLCLLSLELLYYKDCANCFYRNYVHLKRTPENMLLIVAL